jgi:rSAM/selenodomain-associated transferase 1
VETRCLVVFSKPAIAGRVKTRLIGDLSADQAAHLHAALLEDLRSALRRAPFACRWAWQIGDREAIPAGDGAVRQRGADLGERLHHALSEAAREYSRVAVAGSDLPGFSAELAQRAFDALEEADLAIAPAEDGGYSLLALRAAAIAPSLFAGVPWSTPAVARETLARAAALGLRVARLATLPDLDTARDLDALCVRLAAGEPAAGPAVRALLTAWGRLPAVATA